MRKQYYSQISRLIIIRVFASEHHSGQWSRGYKLSSLTSLALKRRGIDKISDREWNQAKKSGLYGYLVNRYADKM